MILMRNNKLTFSFTSFKGEWDAQFDKDLTTERDFHVNKVDTVKVDMMYRKGDYKYTDSRELKAQVR